MITTFRRTALTPAAVALVAAGRPTRTTVEQGFNAFGIFGVSPTRIACQ
jgi:hypothetical protein